MLTLSEQYSLSILHLANMELLELQRLLAGLRTMGPAPDRVLFPYNTRVIPLELKKNGLNTQIGNITLCRRFAEEKYEIVCRL